MHDGATQLAAFSLASFALVAALIPLAGDVARNRALRREAEEGETRTLPPDLRLLVEVAVGCALFAANIRVRLVDGPVDFVLTIGWLVATAHAFAIVDATIDGAGAVVASGVAIGLTIVAALQGQTLVGDIAAILAGASAAALLYNWHPAHVRLTTNGALVIGSVFAALTMQLRYPAHQPAAAAAIVLLAAAPLCFVVLIAGEGWSRRRPLRLGDGPRSTTAPPRLVLDMVGTATAALAIAGVGVARHAVPAWIVFPAALIATVMVLACLAVLERQPEEELVFAGDDQRRQLELPPAADAGPAEITAVPSKWARPTDQTEAFYVRRIPDPAEASGSGPSATTIPGVEAEAPGGGDKMSFRWRHQPGDPMYFADMPPIVEEPESQPPPQEAPPPRPEPSVSFEPPRDPSFTHGQAADVYDLHADVRDLMRMSKTMLDTLAAQLKQNEESARLVTGHLGSTESQLASVADRIRSLADGLAQPPPVALDAERLSHGLRRVEARLQALSDSMERQGAAHGEMGSVIDQTAALRQKQGELATLLGDVSATQQAMQVNLGALRNEQLVAARSIQSDLSTMAVQTGELRQAQADFTAALSEQAASLRSLQADIAAGGGQTNIDRYLGTIADVVRRTVTEELRREGPEGRSIETALSEQASALRSLQGDLTSILSEQAAAIRSLQASAANDGVQRGDLDRLRTDLFTNQERQFANIVGVIRTLLHDSDELVLAMGRVPKSDRAGRAFDMLRLSGGSGWEGREPQG